MTILGLTGSIGMGKSTTAQMFRQRGIPVWDADATVDRLYGREGAAVGPLGAVFPSIIREDAVDRAALRDLIRRDPTALTKVEDIVHPLVAADRDAFLSDDALLAVLDVPLLFETGLDRKVDKVAVVTVDAATQRSRVLARGTMDEAQFEAILARQMPDADKRSRADYIIETTDLETAAAAVDRIIAELT